MFDKIKGPPFPGDAISTLQMSHLTFYVVLQCADACQGDLISFLLIAQDDPKGYITGVGKEAESYISFYK